MATETIVRLKPVVHFREFPFGSFSDPSMLEFMEKRPWEHQEKVLNYLRSGHVLGVTMGANLTDCFDRPNRANPVIRGKVEGGTTPMSDGEYFWYAGLIHFVEKYHVRLPEDFVRHAEEQGWQVDRPLEKNCQYDFSQFEE